jgi:hypothetical protein
MNRLLSLVLLITGIILLVYSFNASESIGSQFSRFFTGAPTDKTIWLLFVGGVATAFGLGGLLRAPKSTGSL